MDFDLNLIEMKCPKAYKQMLLWLEQYRGFDESLKEEGLIFIKDFTRELYTFFDNKGILILPRKTAYSPNHTDCSYTIDIFFNNNRQIVKKECGLNIDRTKAEYIAFTHAFDILERILNNIWDKLKYEIVYINLKEIVSKYSEKEDSI